MKFYFLRMMSDEVGTTLKHPETINGNVKNLSKMTFFYLSFLSFYLMFIITINCFRMFESGSNLIEPHREKVEFYILFKFQRT